MRFHVVLLTAFLLLALVTVKDFARAKTTAVGLPKTRSILSTVATDDGVNATRRLRSANNIETEDDVGSALESTDAEDRGIFSSIGSKLTKAKEKLKMSAKWRSWAIKGEKDDYVKKALGLEGLSGTALTSHKNYKYFQKFTYKKEGRQLDRWIYDDVPTYNVWKKLGLDNVPREQISKTPQYKTYVRYVNKYADDYLWYPEKHSIKFIGSPLEKTAKAEIWAKGRRSKSFVKKMLGLKDMQKKQRQNDPDYEYYKHYLSIVGKRG
ncbi:hypothetical protein PHYBOEH_008990 [Phytophthora boehmeriae]|uniref:RxLR effector protein n=1 Tax=Phytophthora boehmeriae TaxID=109152 RepID=A0A8T1VXB4_9STRA|nr:hypothetical protein PHYBOEH_008990 [Phytophthora boehmeriae]